MAILYDTTTGTTNAMTAVGGSISADDELIFANTSATITEADLDAAELDSVTFSPTFRGGTADGVSFLLNLDGANYTGLLTFDHNGRNVAVSASAAGSAGTIATTVVKNTGSGQAVLTGGTFSLIEQTGGQVYAGSAASVAAIKVVGGITRLGTHSSDTYSTVEVLGTGSFETQRAGTTINQYGGRATSIDSKPTNLNIFGGTFVYEHNAALSNVVIGPGGVLDMRRAKGNLTVTATVYPGARILDSKSFNITYTLTQVANESAVIE